MNHYDVLGIKRNATDKEIAAAWRLAARRTHPDLTGGTSEAYEAARNAWETLSHKATRHGYDMLLDSGLTPPLPKPAPARTPSIMAMQAQCAYYAQPLAPATIVATF